MTRKIQLQRQITRLSLKNARLEQISSHLSWARLFIILFSFVLAGVAIFLRSNTLAGLAIGSTVFIFGGFTFYHSRIKKSIEKHSKLISIYTLHLNRLDLNWSGLPHIPNNKKNDHPFGFDLDIYGEFSLQRLIDQCTTRTSAERLENWLLNPDLNAEKIQQRQNQIRALKKHTLLRNKLLLLNLNPTFEKTDTTRLIHWLKEDTLKISPWKLPVLIVLGLLNLLLYSLDQSGIIAPIWHYSLAAYVIIHLSGQSALGTFFENAIDLAEDLRKIFKTFRYLENFKVSQESALKTVFSPIQKKDQKPSQGFKKLNRSIALIGLRMNPAMAVLLNIIFPWDYIVAMQLKRRTAYLNNAIAVWLESWFHIDALSSMAQFAWLYPHYTFAEIQSETTPANLLCVREAGHPLIHPAARINNDFTIAQNNQINIITGSNMSGKSTFLRTIGINLVLAYSGAPVCAAHFSCPLYKIYSCIRINDSLSEGLSYFYAEVKRLKEILVNVENKSDLSVLFLIDEIFKGTNNKERLAGSLAYIRELSSQKGIGIISTHDLELVNLEKDIPQLKNWHFREEIINGKMSFDYLLRTGPSPTTNALKIMELEGLPVKS